MSNYTKPNDDNYDNSQDWLSSALIFASALGNILKENEGIVVKLEGDMKLGLEDLKDCDTVIVYSKDNQINLVEGDSDLKAGQMVWFHGDEMSDFSNFESDL